jgi:hypothetical protein
MPKTQRKSLSIISKKFTKNKDSINDALFLKKLDFVLEILKEHSTSNDSHNIKRSETGKFMSAQISLSKPHYMDVTEIFLLTKAKGPNYITWHLLHEILNYLKGKELITIFLSEGELTDTFTDPKTNVKTVSTRKEMFEEYAISFEGLVLINSGGFYHRHMREVSKIRVQNYTSIAVAVGTIGVLVIELVKLFCEK